MCINQLPTNSKLKNRVTVCLTLFLFSLFFSALPAQTTPDISYGLTVLPSYGLEMIEERINAQLEVYPQEKIHLHTDRNFYIPGEKIWFKAYVVDAHSHLYPTYSQYVYVELISPADTLVNRVMVRQEDDMFYGHLPLSELIPEGDYTLRAYTRYMENQGDDYFFKKNIRIENLTSVKNQREQTAERNRNRRTQTGRTASLTDRFKEDFDVSFFPEGGNLLEGIFSKVAFKAINKNGYPETVSGKIVDENGIEITSAETYYVGMGVFNYIPQAGKKYFLKCENDNGVEKQFELPKPHPRAYSLSATWRGKRLMVGIQKSMNAPDISCYLLIHSKGSVLHFSEWDKRYGSVTLMEEQLPAGVIQFVLFDGQMNPLSERLVFNKNDDASAKVEFHTDKEVYENRDKVVATLSLPDSPFSLPFGEGRGGAFSHFSVAITDDLDIAVDESTTILSSLLLSSELKGYIENPAYYLRDDVAMDYLMMTHGWRRYNIPEVVKGNFEFPQTPFQISHKISGTVKNLLTGRPVAGSEIIAMMRGGGVSVTSTDRNGFFIFPDAEFPDSATFYIQALNYRRIERERHRVKLVVNDESFPALNYALQTPAMVSVTEAEPQVNALIEKADQRAMYDDDLRVYHIEEVKITAPRIQKLDEPRLRFWANSSSNQIVRRDDLEKLNLVYLADYLVIFVPGARYQLSSFGNPPTVSWRNIGGRGTPVVFVDGIHREDGWGIPVGVIESIDIFKSGYQFGMIGANGAISITTRLGNDVPVIRHNHAVYTPLGYQQPAEFYSPKYDSLEAKQSRIPDLRTTIYWKPDVVISEDGKVSIEFYTSDFRSTYSVVIEGISSDGRIVREVKKIRVE